MVAGERLEGTPATTPGRTILHPAGRRDPDFAPDRTGAKQDAGERKQPKWSNHASSLSLQQIPANIGTRWALVASPSVALPARECRSLANYSGPAGGRATKLPSCPVVYNSNY